jgi:hypothetical protein
VVSLRSNPRHSSSRCATRSIRRARRVRDPKVAAGQGELVEDFHNANAQVDFHNEEFHEGVEAYVALRIGGAFIGPVMG